MSTPESRPTPTIPHRKTVSIISIILLCILYLPFFSIGPRWLIWVGYGGFVILMAYMARYYLDNGLTSRFWRSVICILLLGSFCWLAYDQSVINAFINWIFNHPGPGGVMSRVGEALFWFSLGLNACFDIAAIIIFIFGKKRWPRTFAWLRRWFWWIFIGFDILALLFMMLWVMA